MPAAPLLAWLPIRIARLISSGASRSSSTKCQNSVLSGPRGRAGRIPRIPFGKIEWLPNCTQRAQSAEPPLDLGHRRVVVLLEQPERLARHAVHVAGCVGAIIYYQSSI